MKIQFSIRDLLWLTALCAVLIAWGIDHQRVSVVVDKFKLESNELNERWGLDGTPGNLRANLLVNGELLHNAYEENEKLRLELEALKAEASKK